jgi:hypothetical protein
MSQPQQAHRILSQAREILMQRLAERVLENQEEILDDARGNSYLGEIEALYEQMGMKLSHLNQILSALPNDFEMSGSATEGSDPYRSSDPGEGARDYDATGLDSSPTSPYGASPSAPQLLALPAPIDESPLRSAVQIEIPPAAIEDFVAAAFEKNESTAAVLLGRILDCGHDQATVCSRVFIERFREGGNIDDVVHVMHQRIVLGGYNDGLMLLWDYFGLSGFHAIAALQTLRLHLTRS